MRVQLKPLSKRAKDRINSHGDTFTLMDEELISEGEQKDKILVQSLHNTDKGWTKWMGWFDLGVEAEILKRQI